MINSCDTSPIDKSPKYELTYVNIVPDSLKDKQRKWITETVSATNLHMTGGDYEDPEDVIEEASDQSKNLFSVSVPTLYKKEYGSDIYYRMMPIELTQKEKEILSKLLEQ